MVLQRALQDAPETGENGSSVPQDTTEMSNSKVEHKDEGAPWFPGNHAHKTTPSATAKVFVIIMLMVLIVALHRETTAQFTETDAKAQVLRCLTHSHSPVMQQKNPRAPVS
ncbi:hypothetical protein ACRRTK_009990 [Alexandromys fortis]